MKSVIFKNHINLDMYLYEDVYRTIIEKDEKKTKLRKALVELFAQPDEIYLYDYSGDASLIAYKYIKFYNDCALFGIVDIMNHIEMHIIDFYRIDTDEIITDNGKYVNKIDFERKGKLIKGSD